jgi:hypothetical protein
MRQKQGHASDSHLELRQFQHKNASHLSDYTTVTTPHHTTPQQLSSQAETHGKGVSTRKTPGLHQAAYTSQPFTRILVDLSRPAGALILKSTICAILRFLWSAIRVDEGVRSGLRWIPY